MAHYYIPQWTLPTGVRAAISNVARPGNLAAHVGADPASVVRNRRHLVRDLQLPNTPKWLAQYHSAVSVDYSQIRSGARADALYSSTPQSICAVLTADCLPLLLCSQDGQEIAAIHAGWRGLAAGIVTTTLKRFKATPNAIQVFIGPAISQPAFEVGVDVYDAFSKLGWVDSDTFAPHIEQKWWANLPLLAEYALRECGIESIQHSQECTFTSDQWYSYRREPQSGRFASLIWRSA